MQVWPHLPNLRPAPGEAAPAVIPG